MVKFLDSDPPEFVFCNWFDLLIVVLAICISIFKGTCHGISGYTLHETSKYTGYGICNYTKNGKFKWLYSQMQIVWFIDIYQEHPLNKFAFLVKRPCYLYQHVVIRDLDLYFCVTLENKNCIFTITFWTETDRNVFFQSILNSIDASVKNGLKTDCSSLSTC